MFKQFLKTKKYKNVSCKCEAGHIHDSRLEAKHCNSLYMISRSGEIKEIKRQVSFPLIVNGVTICVHRVDFLITWKNGKKEVIESKGFATDVWAIKHKLFMAIHPEIPYTVWKKG